VFFCNVILSRVIGPRLSLSLNLPFIYNFFQEPQSPRTTHKTDSNTRGKKQTRNPHTKINSN